MMIEREPRDNVILDAIAWRFGEQAALRGAEVGVSYGVLSAKLLERFPVLLLHMIDRWELWPHRRLYRDAIAARTLADSVRCRAQAQEATAFALQRREVICADSLQAAPRIADGSLDWVLIDADHSREATLEDMQAYWPKLRPGGLMFADDLDSPLGVPYCWGIREAVEAFSAEQSLGWLDLGHHVAVFRKPCRAAVLCPGPSLESFPGREGYDVLIGVNRAAGRFACDYWAMLDAVPFYHTTPIGAPAALCQYPEWVKVLKYIADGGNPCPHRHLDLKDVDAWLRPELHGVPARFKYSMLAGITLAHAIGAVEVDVYGADWAGTQDFDGVELAKNCRDDRRWRLEKEGFHVLTTSLLNFGTRVRRVLPQAVPA